MFFLNTEYEALQGHQPAKSPELQSHTIIVRNTIVSFLAWDFNYY